MKTLVIYDPSHTDEKIACWRSLKELPNRTLIFYLLETLNKCLDNINKLCID